ncbi:fumarylacetoacetate hydrolase family protein [Shinella sp. M27]|uniref:fumarylacetoacetate hydrolase family protein n=1 Tax=Shinella sp. M27 TaxID=3368614 RepID=UPI003B9FCC6A
MAWYEEGCFIGRAWSPEARGPILVTIREGRVLDVTSKDAPTVRDLLDRDDPAAFLQAATGRDVGSLEDLLDIRQPDLSHLHLLAPFDLQAIKACGVTFARSMIERVIEERAAGDPARAASIRDKVAEIIGVSLRDFKAGSEAAQEVKAALIEENLWSQYLEVGIGPDAEVFTKSQVLSAVGTGADVGLHPNSRWNNPEPEIVLAVDSEGVVKGATIGNDVNLRDIEGRSALLLGKAKDNNASCAIGPFIRLFDRTYSIDDVRNAELDLHVAGQDGFILRGRSSMKEISRDPLDLVAQTQGRHHQYPDGFALFLGTLFAPVQDRDTPGHGFTHKIGDVVTISNDKLGALMNRVMLSTECAPWTYGASHLMRNLASRNLL